MSYWDDDEIVARVLVVSRTRMSGGCVCVGGIDLDNKCSIRLAHGEKAGDCGFEIGELYNCKYEWDSYREAPHNNEDIDLIEYSYKGKVYDVDASIRDVLQKSGGGIPYVQGFLLLNAFGRCLKNNGRSAFVERSRVPEYSTCFWIADETFFKTNPSGKVYFKYNGISIPWVGCEDAPKIIKKGTLVRLSLAHWWSRSDDDPERCYLQISGIY